MFFQNKRMSAPGSRATWLFVLAFLALVALLLALSLRMQYKRILVEAEDRLMAEARTVDENVGVNLTVANLLLTNIIQMLQADPPRRPAEINAYLRKQEKLTPGIRTFLVTDRQGRVIMCNRPEIIGYDARDRDYFKAAVAAGPDRLTIGAPFRSILGAYVVSIARVVPGHHGEFRGVVTATLNQDYFATLLASVVYSPDNRVALVHSSGSVFISVPDPKRIEGRNLELPGSFFQKHMNGGQRSSLYRGITAATGENRFLAFVTSGLPGLPVNNPLIVMASRDEREVLSPWVRDAVVQVALYLLFSGFTVAVAVVVLNRRQERRIAEEERGKFRHLESLGLLAGGIAHDFNNLLTGIVGYIEIAKMPPHEHDKIDRSLTEAKNICLRAKELSDRLRTFATGGNPVPRKLPIAGVIREGVQEALAGSAIEAAFTFAPGLNSALIDEKQMRQVFLNLALNARDAMPAGGRLHVHAENIRIPSHTKLPLPEGPYVSVVMQDTGVGIHSENRMKIFDPYFSTKEHFNQKGLGLGLAVCHSIVTRHGGMISAQPGDGGGTKFILLLPAAVDGPDR